MSDGLKASDAQAERLHRFAHDLRNRLAALRQAAEQLSDAGPRDRDELLGFAEEQYFKALRATEELLDDLAVDRGVGQLKVERVDLKQLVESEIGLLAHRFQRKNQALMAQMEDGITIVGDPHWIKQAVAALLSNASKFSANSQPITVGLRREGDHARLSVTDRGIGLTAEDAAQVFVRYAMLGGRTTAGEAQGRSTLARARQWALAHNGDLEASSPGPGQGSTFSLRLPLA
jgi:signal transduction histidine kinase